MNASGIRGRRRSDQLSQQPSLSTLVGQVCHIYGSTPNYRLNTAINQFLADNSKHPGLTKLRRLTEIMQGNATSSMVARKPEAKPRTDTSNISAVAKTAAKKGRNAMLGLLAGTLNSGGNIPLLQTCLAVMEEQKMLIENRQ